LRSACVAGTHLRVECTSTIAQTCARLHHGFFPPKVLVWSSRNRGHHAEDQVPANGQVLAHLEVVQPDLALALLEELLEVAAAEGGRGGGTSGGVSSEALSRST